MTYPCLQTVCFTSTPPHNILSKLQADFPHKYHQNNGQQWQKIESLESNCGPAGDQTSDPLLNPFPHNDAFWRVWEKSLLKTLWEKEKLPTMFSTLSKTGIIIFVTFNLWSSDAFNLDQSKILLSGNGLSPVPWFQTELPGFVFCPLNYCQDTSPIIFSTLLIGHYFVKN